MIVNRETISHMCDLARRQLGLHTRDLSLFFIIHDAGRRAAEIEAQKGAILKLKYGPALLAALESHRNGDENECPGLLYARPYKLFGFQRQDRFIAPIFINLGKMESKALAHHTLYHLLWHALLLADRFETRKGDEDAEDFIVRNNLIQPKDDLWKMAENNLMADLFAAIITETEQEKGFIEKLARRRTQAVLQKKPGYLCETYPYPLVSEACRFIYNDLKFGLKDKNQLLPFAIKMAREISMTYGDEALRQWADFCLPAQHMAWTGCEAQTILNHAVFNSENTYVRAIGYLICDHLNHAPVPPAGKLAYNPFLKAADNADAHRRACEAALQQALYEVTLGNDTTAFHRLAEAQNARLLDGNPVGWCAHALIEAARYYDTVAGSEDFLEVLSAQFHSHLDRVPWDTLAQAGRNIIRLKRRSLPYSIGDMCAGIRSLPGIDILARTLGGTSKTDFEQAQTPQVSALQTLRQRIAAPLNITLGLRQRTEPESAASAQK